MTNPPTSYTTSWDTTWPNLQPAKHLVGEFGPIVGKPGVLRTIGNPIAFEESNPPQLASCSASRLTVEVRPSSASASPRSFA